MHKEQSSCSSTSIVIILQHNFRRAEEDLRYFINKVWYSLVQTVYLPNPTLLTPWIYGVLNESSDKVKISNSASALGEESQKSLHPIQ